jgi:hypothetical protein
MPALLFGIGIFALFAGLVMVGFGIPINEFSFGNTLISSGTTAAVGGLIIIGLGLVVGQLRRVVEVLTIQTAVQPAQSLEAFENTNTPGPIPVQGHISFPPRPKPDIHAGGPAAVSSVASGIPAEDRSVEFAPTLRNPDEAPGTVEDDVSLSPYHPPAPATSTMADKSRESGWRSPTTPGSAATSPQGRPYSTNFDAMWPAEPKASKGSGVSDLPTETRREAPPRETPTTEYKSSEPEKPRTAAILKSGVVDGMGYTLYVDGSIEAELPQGTLRFASINELRSHLAKNS